MDISVIIPVFNEEKNVVLLYPKLKNILETVTTNYEIIFVDDGSKDDTLKNLIEFYKKDNKVKIIVFKKNFGQSAALKAGFEYAKGGIIITMDGDLQNDPNDVPLLLNKLKQGYDVVSGWRHKRKDNISKRFFSKISNEVHRKLTGLNIHDSGCSLKAYKKEAIKDLELYGELHRYIPAILNWGGYKISEIKVRHHKRKYGKTKYGMKRLIKGFLDLMNIKFWNEYATRPLHFFGGIGIVFVMVGIILGLYLSFQKLILGITISNKATLFLVILLILLGFQLVFFGFLASIITRVYHTKNYDKVYNINKTYSRKYQKT